MRLHAIWKGGAFSLSTRVLICSRFFQIALRPCATWPACVFVRGGTAVVRGGQPPFFLRYHRLLPRRRAHLFRAIRKCRFENIASSVRRTFERTRIVSWRSFLNSNDVYLITIPLSEVSAIFSKDYSAVKYIP